MLQKVEQSSLSICGAEPVSVPTPTAAVAIEAASASVSVDPVISVDHFLSPNQIPSADDPQTDQQDKEEQRKGIFMDLHPVLKSFLIGSISGTCSTVLFQPLDLLKTRIQSPLPLQGTSTGMISVASHILRTENFLSLWRGMTPSLTRCVPGVGLYFATIHALKSSFSIEEPSALQSVLLGVSGRSFSGLVMIPFTVVKTRFESRVYEYTSIRGALSCIYRQEGVKGLTCGLIPTLLRDAPFSGLYLMMYTSTKKAVGKDWIESQSVGPYVRFSCGIVAGVGASLVTQPFDVIKTKMQLYPEKFGGVKDVVPYVYNKYGLQGYFKGLMPRMIRRTLVAAMSWTVYEQLIHNLGLK